MSVYIFLLILTLNAQTIELLQSTVSYLGIFGTFLYILRMTVDVPQYYGASGSEHIYSIILNTVVPDFSRIGIKRTENTSSC